MKVEIITFDADPDHGGFGARVYNLIRMFSEFAKVRVVLTDWFEGSKVPGVIYKAEPVSDNVRSRLRRLRTYYKTDFPERRVADPPDIAVVESLDLLGLFQYGEDVPLVLDEHNVYWELLQYGMVDDPFFKTWLGRKELVRKWLIPSLLRRAKSFEIDALRRATRTLVPSESDRGLILAELPELGDRICVLPNCVDLDRIPSPKEARGRTDVVFLGNYNYLPNRNAATYVSHNLAPNLPETRFVLVGSSPPPEVGMTPNVVATGYVRDLDSILENAAVCIAPLSHGSGTRLKILLYLAAGKAVVATTKACEGLDVEDQVHLLIRDDLDGFQSAISRLLQDPDLRERMGADGRRLVEEKYDWRVYVPWLREFVREILEARAADRTV